MKFFSNKLLLSSTIIVTLLVILIFLYFAFGFYIGYQILHTDHGCGVDEGSTPNNFDPANDIPLYEDTEENAPILKKLREFPKEKYFTDAWEEVRFPSRDKKGIKRATIAGWYYKHNGNLDNKTVIVVHGIDPSGKCNSRSLLTSGMLFKSGFNVLNIDLRNYGDSSILSDYIKLGAEEYLDILGAFDFLLGKGVAANKIGVLGISLGGTTAIYAAANEKRISAIWVDSSYSTFSKVVDDELGRLGLPSIFHLALNLAGRVLINTNLSNLNPVLKIKDPEQAFFFTHGRRDKRMYFSHFLDFKNYFEKNHLSGEFWPVDKVKHVEAVVAYPDEYQRRLKEFFDEHLQ